MAMHPSFALRRFIHHVQPNDGELAAARRHFGTIQSRLAKSFGLARIVQIGSHSRGTAIAVHSDLDILAVLPREEARWSGRLVSPNTFIQRVAGDLGDRYTTTNVRRDGQAVVLNFHRGAHAVDVVPGFFVRVSEGRPVYAIPGTNREWIETSPERHNVVFARANLKSGGKLRMVSQLIKGWRFGRTPPIGISSFYTDLLLATTDIATGVKSYSECLYDFFRELVRREVRGLRDPAGIAGIVVASTSESTLKRLFAAAQTAYQHAESALHAEVRGNNAEANRQWGIILNRTI